MIKRISLTILALSAILSLSAQTSHLSAPTDARSFAMGGSSVASSDNAFAVLHNIAATATSDNTLAVGANYSNWQPKYLSSQIASLGAYYQVADGVTVGVSGAYEMLPSQSITTSTGRPNGSFSPNGLSVGVGAAYAITDELSVGLNAEYVSTSIYTLKGSAIGADLSVNYRREGYSVALLADNIAFAATNVSMPSSVSVAGSATLVAASEHNLLASARLGYLFAPSTWASPTASVGLEYSYSASYFVRAGYSYSDAKLYMSDYASVGVGAIFSGVALDAAYLVPAKSGSSLAGAFMVSASFSMK